MYVYSKFTILSLKIPILGLQNGMYHNQVHGANYKKLQQIVKITATILRLLEISVQFQVKTDRNSLEQYYNIELLEF